MSGEGFRRMPHRLWDEGDRKGWELADPFTPAPEPLWELVGADLRLADVGPDTMLTRRWRCYAVPLPSVVSGRPDRARVLAAGQLPLLASGVGGA